MVDQINDSDGKARAATLENRKSLVVAHIAFGKLDVITQDFQATIIAPITLLFLN